jgi:4-carboxymuconolactone decarboxylase
MEIAPNRVTCSKANHSPGGIHPMTKERFKPLEHEAMTAEQRRVAQALLDGPRQGIPGPFHALLRSPELADRVRSLGDYVRFQNSLPAKVRELVILMVARFWSAQYELHAHRRHSLNAGLDPAIADAICEDRRPERLDAEEGIAYSFVSELLERKDVSDLTYQPAIDRFGERGVIDMVATAGYFCFVSLVLNTERHPIPDGAVNAAAAEDQVQRTCRQK